MKRPHPLLTTAARALDDADGRLLLARGERWFDQVVEGLSMVYPGNDDVLARSLVTVAQTIAGRPAGLRDLDRHREINPGWFLAEDMVGYVTYVDRFSGDLQGIEKRLDYLKELRVTYLHLMPLLKPRPRPNDGGYAVADYDVVDPELGTMADLESLAGRLRERGVSLCVDVVLNHTAAEHRWAQQARAGDPHFLDFYRTYPDREMPDRWEQTLPEVFPDSEPGNFTFDEEMGRWVWTTFNHWQWDLNWANPDVFVEMLGVMLRLGQRGVDVLRLDAIPFLWKQLGTACQNLPEVHALLQAVRGLMGMAAPAMIIKGEAIVSPDELVSYQGLGRRVRPECDLLYHNQLMVQGWSSLAAQDGQLATIALERMRPTPAHASWVTYVRCHDDIGWAIHDRDAAARGWGGTSHRAFLSRFYAGELDYSNARGAHFQEDFVSGDRRTSGTCAALDGIQAARGDDDPLALQAAIDRHLLLHALAASYGGIPMIYMGDELALGNDHDYLTDPHRSGDNRWMHRPWMDWSAADLRGVDGTVEQRVHHGLARLMSVRSGLPTLRGGGTVTPRHHDNSHVLAFRRSHPATGQFLGLANFSADPQTVDAAAVGFHDLEDPIDALDTEAGLAVQSGRIPIPALSMRWITERSGPGALDLGPIDPRSQ